MSEDSSKTKKLSLSGGKLTLGNIDASKLRASPSVGGSRKTVQVEVRRKRAPSAPQRAAVAVPETTVPETTKNLKTQPPKDITPVVDDRLTSEERAARVRALQEGLAKTEISSNASNTESNAISFLPSQEKMEAVAADDHTEERVVPESKPDPAADRRAAELAELKEIEEMVISSENSK